MPSEIPPPSVPTNSPWLASGRRMSDAESIIVAGLDLDQPRSGITIADRAQGPADTLLGLDLRSDYRLADHWVRGTDVTAVYESVDGRRLRTTAMWRLHPSDGATRAWELVASAQTSLLQSDSVLAVVSEIEASDVLWGTCKNGVVNWRTAPSPEATCVIAKRRGETGAAAMSVLVAAHPGDSRRMTVRKDGERTLIECWLFSTMLEKGVLLRSRVLSAIGPSADSRDWAENIVADFAASPPVLTT